MNESPIPPTSNTHPNGCIFISITILVPGAGGFESPCDDRNARIAIGDDAADLKSSQRDVAFELEPLPGGEGAPQAKVAMEGRAGSQPGRVRASVRVAGSSICPHFAHGGRSVLTTASSFFRASSTGKGDSITNLCRKIAINFPPTA
jgi:hypothetical protein